MCQAAKYTKEYFNVTEMDYADQITRNNYVIKTLIMCKPIIQLKLLG